MKITLRLCLFCFLCACSSTQVVTVRVPPPVLSESGSRSVPAPVASGMKRTFDLGDLQRELGLARDVRDLGFTERDYDGCRMSVPGEASGCGQRFMSVVHFRLMCRDTVGTTSRVPSSLTPLRGNMQWRLNGRRGVLSTDRDGYGQVQLVSRTPSKSQRFMLIIGKKSLGVEAGEVSQIIVPRDWCQTWKL